jgi:hypothetical protein
MDLPPSSQNTMSFLTTQAGVVGQVQLVSKSGANQFHGTAVDNVLNANRWSNNRSGIARSVSGEPRKATLGTVSPLTIWLGNAESPRDIVVWNACRDVLRFSAINFLTSGYRFGV